MKNLRKGFSLVELIVVIAIMAVLMGVLAPSLLKNVEKSRLQTDKSAVGEVVNGIKIAVADDKINQEVIEAGGITITINGNGALTYAPGTSGKPTTRIEAELSASGVNNVNFKSSTLKGKTFTVALTANSNGTAVKVDASFADPGSADQGLKDAADEIIALGTVAGAYATGH